MKPTCTLIPSAHLIRLRYEGATTYEQWAEVLEAALADQLWKARRCCSTLKPEQGPGWDQARMVVSRGHPGADQTQRRAGAPAHARPGQLKWPHFGWSIDRTNLPAGRGGRVVERSGLENRQT